MGPVFKKSEITAKIWCYDHNLNNLWYPRNILKDREAAQYVDGTGFHAYSGTPQQMGEFYKEFPEKSVYFTEGSAGGTGGTGSTWPWVTPARSRNWASVTTSRPSAGK